MAARRVCTEPRWSAFDWRSGAPRPGVLDVRGVRYADNLLYVHDEREAMPGQIELRRSHDLFQHGVVLVGVGHRQHDLLLRLDGHPEDLLLFMNPRPAPKEDGAASRAGLHGRLEHSAAP